MAEAEVTEESRPLRKTKVGRVSSDKMQKTIVVEVEQLRRHRLYHKTVRHTVSFKAHDEENTAHIGDLVRIEETRPLSKEKRWRLLEILEKARREESVAEKNES